MLRRTRRLFPIGLLLALTVSLAAQGGGAIQYVYDELGRLVGVIDQAGNAAVYHYDAVGNLTGITRTGPTQVFIIEFTPNQAGVGGSVTIHGTGFSTTPSLNIVTFNGTAATVVSATANTLVVTIPAGASSGQLLITTPNGSTAATFVISAVATPSITGFSPTIALPGAAVTITGTAFEPTANTNNVSFNVSYATLGTTTATQISTTVPASGTSGRITVATPRGSATSAQDFFVPPAPYGVADVLVADRMEFGQDRVVSLGTAEKIGLLLFDRAAGQRASLTISSVTIPFTTVSIRDPYRRTSGSVSIFPPGGFIDAFTAAVSGTYTILVDPSLTDTGNATLRLHDVVDITGTIMPGGSAVTVTTTVPGQNGRLTFAGTAGQRVSLRRTVDFPMSNTTVSLLNPNGSTLGSTSGGFLDTQTLLVSGVHTVVIDPFATDIGSVTVTLYDVPADVTGPISIGGPSVPVDITTPGQNGQLTFTGTAGQRVSLTLSPAGLIEGPATIRNPDQTPLASGSFGGGTSLIEPVMLPATGTYSILIDPSLHTTGTVTLTLNEVPADVTGPIVPGGSSVLVPISAPGQNARLTFSGTAGQRVSLHGSAGPGGTLAILKPDQMTLAATSTGPFTTFIDVQTLPSEGTYTVLVDPFSANTGSITLTLYDVPADFSSSLTVGGAPVAVTTTVPGQNASVTFAGTANQQVTVRVTGNTMGLVTVTLRREPDGTTLTTSSTNSESFNLTTQTLPTSGTYTVVIDPFQTNAGTLNLSVTNP